MFRGSNAVGRKKFFVMHFVMAMLTGGCWLPTAFAAASTNKPSAAEGAVFRAWGTEAGLPQNTVSVILQTRDGYLWLGTQAGLARFDGVRFKVYGLAEGLPSVQVRALYEDNQGSLWIGTYGELDYQSAAAK